MISIADPTEPYAVRTITGRSGTLHLIAFRKSNLPTSGTFRSVMRR